VTLQAAGWMQGPDCLNAIFARVFIVKVWGHVVFLFFLGLFVISPTAE
jgi:hypothetical protein